MNVEEALLILDTALKQSFLNDLQELVFRQSWSGQTYLEMAESSGYNANYIKDVGYKLWKILAKVFAEDVTKSNFRAVLRRQYVTFQDVQSNSVSEISQTIYPEDIGSVPISDNVSQTQSISDSAPPTLVLVKEINSPKDIISGEEIRAQQIVVTTVLAVPLNAENIKIKNIKTRFLTATSDIKTKETTATPLQGWENVGDVLADGLPEKLNLLKQWIIGDRYQLVAVLANASD